jgi:hypothetical protein
MFLRNFHQILKKKQIDNILPHFNSCFGLVAFSKAVFNCFFTRRWNMSPIYMQLQNLKGHTHIEGINTMKACLNIIIIIIIIIIETYM